MFPSNDDKTATEDATPKDITVDDILKTFKEDDTDEEKVDLLKDDKLKIEDETEEDTEKKDTKEEEDQEETISTPVSVKAIEKKYPDIFKEFPFLKAAYQRDKQFIEVFPTIDDAKEAATNSETYQKFSGDLFNGKIDTVLKSLNNTNKESFARVVDNILPALHSIDEKAYYHLMGNTAKNFISSMVQEAKNSENEELGRAAVIFHQFMFGKSNFEPPTSYGKPVNEQEKTIDKERQEWLNERFNTISEETDRVTTNAIKSTIDLHIDPKGVMSPFVRKNAVREALEFIEDNIREDTATSRQLTKLWSDAASKNFNKSSIENIKRTYLGKARTLLQDAIKRARAEALKTGSSRTSAKDEEQEDKVISTPRRVVEQRSSNPKDKYKGMSTRQVLDLD